MGLNIKSVISVLLISLLGGCDSTDFAGTVAQTQIPEPAIPPLEPINEPDAGAIDIQEDLGRRIRLETFELKQGDQTQTIDYLFVLDNSPSMVSDLNRLRQGFRSIREATFPKGSKLAVTYTQPADPDNPVTVFPYGSSKRQQPTKAYNAEPGFLGLVDKKRIATYRNTTGANRSNFSRKGCDKWFEPSAKNADGESCFDAHIQISEKGGLCEAGMVALDQLLKAKKGQPLFRSGTSLQVIFITDTEDPGCPKRAPYLGLDKARPSTAALVRAFKANSKLESLTFHGAVPKSKCPPHSESSPFNFGKPYAAAIRSTKGIHVDMCTTIDYSQMIENIIISSKDKPASTTFQLSKEVVQVDYVLVDGQKYQDFTVRGNSIEIRNLNQEQSYEIKVAYNF